MVAASNHVLYDNNLLECKRQEDESRVLRALLTVDKNNKSDKDNDNATLDLSESENYDKLLHGNSMNSSKHSFHSSPRLFADYWTTFVHEQPERLSSTTHRVSESFSSTKDCLSESLVNFAVEPLGKRLNCCGYAYPIG
jgi:hypothetical protein